MSGGVLLAFAWVVSLAGFQVATYGRIGVATEATGEVGFPQDSFNRSADRGRSAWDRPHRVAVNGVFELPFFRQQKGALGKLLGGWQSTGFLTLQSGAPFSVLGGTDPGLRLSGLVTTVRANSNTALDVSGMSLEQIFLAGGARLFSHVTVANPLGNTGRNILRSSPTRKLLV